MGIMSLDYSCNVEYMQAPFKIENAFDPLNSNSELQKRITISEKYPQKVNPSCLDHKHWKEPEKSTKMGC